MAIISLLVIILLYAYDLSIGMKLIRSINMKNQLAFVEGSIVDVVSIFVSLFLTYDELLSILLCGNNYINC
jgi:hypothetical protein